MKKLVFLIVYSIYLCCCSSVLLFSDVHIFFVAGTSAHPPAYSSDYLPANKVYKHSRY